MLGNHCTDRDCLPAGVDIIFAIAKRVSRFGSGAIACAGLAALALAASPASAQTQPGCTSTLPAPYGPFFSQIIGGVAGASNAITSVIGTVNTAFQAQGDAFAVGLPNAKTDQIAGGMWARTIGGRADNQATSTFTGSVANVPGVAGTITCNSNIREDYFGFQVGQDLARLNLSGSGATLHLGLTEGYAQSGTQDLGGSNFTGSFQVPFAGGYATYTNNRFFADILVRGDFYQMNLGAAAASLGNQKLGAIGLTQLSSAGYSIDLGKSWFLELSGSGIHSTTKIDTLNLPGGWGSLFNPFTLPAGTVQFANVESWMGRVGARVGTSFTEGNVVLQPFATASVWHEFAGNTFATYTAPQLGNTSGTLTGSRVGTYGQYSLGLFGQMTGSPWLGYLRIDLKEGDNIQALGFNGGIRYQFDPSTTSAVGISKAPARSTPYAWSGFYAGGVSGAEWGRSSWNLPQTATSADPQIAGVLGGGTVGYNKQIDRWVVGGEADITWGNASGGQSCQPGVNDLLPVQNCDSDRRMLATVTARAGYTWLDRILFYAKAGVAWTDEKRDVSCNGEALYQSGQAAGCIATNTGAAVQDLIVRDSRVGGTVGGGFELALSPAWSTKIEYDYLAFGSKNLILPDTTPVSIRESLSEVKVGLNYHFNASDDPASAASAPITALKMPVKVPPPATQSWTGGYVGLELGDQVSDAKWTTTAMPLFPFFFPAEPVPDPTTNSAKFTSGSATGGVFAGYDWQIASRWVAGIEGNVDFADSAMTRGGIPGTYGNGDAPTLSFFGILTIPGIEAEQVDSAAVKYGWNGSLRARLGFLSTPSVLVYGTGGLAFQEIKASASCDASVASLCFLDLVPRSETASTVKAGWTLGGGVEGILTGNWVGKAEFRYADFGHFTHDFFVGSPEQTDVSIRAQTYTFLGGIGYKFSANGSLLSH
jgi:opacity protein-like surface antigen